MTMIALRHLALTTAALTLASCGLGDDENYDTSDPYGTGYADTGYNAVNPPADNPTYGNAAYTETTQSAPSYNPAPAVSAPTASGGSHTVAKGDTLWSLSKRYGVSVDSIRSANGMGNGDNNIRIGQSLSIPAN